MHKHTHPLTMPNAPLCFKGTSTSNALTFPVLSAPQLVCRYWLNGTCQKGDRCDYLHVYDPSRVPLCPNTARTGVCHDPNCVYMHTGEDANECYLYRLGFCPYGPACR